MPSLREALLRHAKYYEATLREADHLYDQGGNALRRGLTTFDSAWANIQAGQAWAESQADKDDEAAALNIAYQNAGPHLFDLRQHPRERIRRLTTVLAAARRLIRRYSEASALSHLGVAYADLGETRRAIEFHEQSPAVSSASAWHTRIWGTHNQLSISTNKRSTPFAKSVPGAAKAAMKIQVQIEDSSSE